MLLILVASGFFIIYFRCMAPKPERILVHYQFQMLNFRRLKNTIEYLGQLIVTPEMVAKKIKAMKDIKSPGVDGIPPKLLMEAVEQNSIPLPRTFNLSLKEGVVLFEWKQTSYHYLKRVRAIDQTIMDQ